jgi:hypothetical protein
MPPTKWAEVSRSPFVARAIVRDELQMSSARAWRRGANALAAGAGRV